MEGLTALSTFVRAAETRGFTDAGRHLGVSASAVGKTVARLEERLGTRLFHRSTRSVTLTAEGEIFLETCRKVIEELNSVEQKLARARQAPNGKLRVSLPILPDLFMPALKIFMEAYPHIELDLSFSDQLVDVIEEGFDIAIRTGDGSDSRLMSRTVGAYRLQIVGSPSYFERFGTPLTPADLVDHACLHHRYPTTGKLETWPFVRDSIPEEQAIPITMAASTLPPLLSLTMAGAGITCLPDFITAEPIADGRLVRILEQHTTHHNVFRAVWPSSRHLSPKIRVFVDTLVEHLFADRLVPDLDGKTMEDVNASSTLVTLGEPQAMR